MTTNREEAILPARQVCLCHPFSERVRSMSAHLLQLKDITKSFAGVHALKGVSFDLRPGEVHAIVGENGAGKSTLIKVITGAHQPDSGTLTVNGQLIEKNDPTLAKSRGIAVIYQQ